jgi:hypothetical protein
MVNNQFIIIQFFDPSILPPPKFTRSRLVTHELCWLIFSCCCFFAPSRLFEENLCVNFIHLFLPKILIHFHLFLSSAPFCALNFKLRFHCSEKDFCTTVVVIEVIYQRQLDAVLWTWENLFASFVEVYKGLKEWKVRLRFVCRKIIHRYFLISKGSFEFKMSLKFYSRGRNSQLIVRFSSF